MKAVRILVTLILLSPVLASAVLAQGWTTYTNARYGAKADVPPGFEPAGPEARNSDGLIFRSHDGGFLTIYGADVPGRNFEAKIQEMMAHEKSYNGWNINAHRITPDWAEFSSDMGSRHLRVRAIASCNGRQVVVTRFEFSGNQKAISDRIKSSLQAVRAKSC